MEYNKAYHLYLRTIAPFQDRHTTPIHVRGAMMRQLRSWDMRQARLRWRKVPFKPYWVVRLVCRR